MRNLYLMRKQEQSAQLFENAKTLFPGGVNSPVRAFKSVGGTPPFIKKGKGCKITDEDDNTYIDFCGSWGPLILGHADDRIVKAIQETAALGTSFGAPTKLESELAGLIVNNIAHIDQIRFTSSGTEAAMSAIRLARGVTGRDKIVKFDGCYHGHFDAVLVNAGSGLVTLGESSSAGIPENYTKETIVLPLNNKEALDACIEKYGKEIACICIEPIPANNGLLLQDKSFLTHLREVCTQHGILLFFDEVISGFRVAFGGATEYYGIVPDMVAYGKIIGGGMPVGAFAAKKEVMAHVSPLGPVYQAGTLSGNPVAMAAGAAQIRALLEDGFYEDQERRTRLLVDQVNHYADQKGYAFEMFTVGSIFWLAFSDKEKISSAAEIDSHSMNHFKVFHKALLDEGVYIGPSGYEVGFVSAAHIDEDINTAAKKMCASLDKVFDPS